PHSYLHVAAADENGKTREYVCESHGVTQLSRAGITPQILKAGTKGRVTGSLSRHSPYMCFFDNIEVEDGPTLSVNRPRTAAEVPRAKGTDLCGAGLRAPTANRSRGGPQPMTQFRPPAGKRGVAAYDPSGDAPTSRCDRGAARRVGGPPATPLEVIRDGGD